MWAKGIRPRLILAFTAVSLLATIAASGASYVSGRRTVLTSEQNETIIGLRNAVDVLAPQLTMPPTSKDLAQLADRLPGFTGVTFQGQQPAEGNHLDVTVVPAELRTAVSTGLGTKFQRGIRYDRPVLWIGMPILRSTPDGKQERSGIEVYGEHDLGEAVQSIEEFSDNGWTTGTIAVPLAILIAWLAAEAVLRPVRRLRDAARRLADGELSTRLATPGADELTELAKTFNHTASSLETSVGELRRMQADAHRFVADVSHELRTPLAAMTAVTDLLEEETGLDSDTGRAARLVGSETRNLTRLVEDLIEISRFDSGTARLDRQLVDVGALIGQTLRARGWTDSVETDLPGDQVALLDRRRLDVIVANLVGNALRHGEPPVRVTVGTAGTSVVVTVTDQGPGLPEHVLPHVFDRLYKADTARSRSEGSGLGLAIAAENATLHGGTLEAANQPGGGASFTLRLPIDGTTA
ncbi:HAMP domain-containing sensor histidine kinase [Amycolatopsis sp. H20-H5]|uniref:HAMP domain-containing sensor histidine kinase n=1 Tax=Amycolatopsis sp. H20-H5 TaxID=3046309 RepID=UPI002DB864D9|nr:HAMP domain-containing sensor histidine kinase [Amycolatopsis sp. H20-H5]MEC3976032.1 HAMP domain-containing sensor histidine kinase [Amycolatopsis sp. H20-H5]